MLLLLLACEPEIEPVDSSAAEDSEPVVQDSEPPADSEPIDSDDCVPVEETCNGVDDDCDDAIDEGTLNTYYRDADGDGYGRETSSAEGCEAPEGYVDDKTDCDDSDDSAFPGGTEVCDGADNDCNQETDDGDALGSHPNCAADSCTQILEADAAASSGAYSIAVGEGAEQLYCDMNGGWLLVANFVWPGDTSGVPGWTSADAVGTTYSDLFKSFKLSDADINALVTEAYRGWGDATTCLDGPCSVDLKRYWDASCTYDSTTSSTGACAVAYSDPDLTQDVGWNAPCSWHYGLTSVDCSGSVSEMGTSHSGDHVFVGHENSSSHAYSGREGEDPNLRVFVR